MYPIFIKYYIWYYWPSVFLSFNVFNGYDASVNHSLMHKTVKITNIACAYISFPIQYLPHTLSVHCSFVSCEVICLHLPYLKGILLLSIHTSLQLSFRVH